MPPGRKGAKRKKGMVSMDNKVLVETSARHVHVTEKDLEILFGKGAALTLSLIHI